MDLGGLRPVIDVSSPEFPCGILAHHDSAHPKGTLGLTGEPHAAPSDLRARAELISLAARRVPIVSVCDGEPGLLDSPGSIVVNQQVPLANRVFNECCRPD